MKFIYNKPCQNPQRTRSSSYLIHNVDLPHIDNRIDEGWNSTLYNVASVSSWFVSILVLCAFRCIWVNVHSAAADDNAMRWWHDVHSSVSFQNRAATHRAYTSLRCLRAQLCDDAWHVFYLSSSVPLYAYWSIERMALLYNWKPNIIHINHWNWLLFRSTCDLGSIRGSREITKYHKRLWRSVL